MDELSTLIHNLVDKLLARAPVRMPLEESGDSHDFFEHITAQKRL